MTALRSETSAALITGASSGIGRATALELARRGLHVVLVCRDPERTRAVCAEIAALDQTPGSTLLSADLSRMSEVRRVAQEALALPQPLQIVINNAATWSASRTSTPDGFERTLAVNYLAPFVLSHWLVPRLRLHHGMQPATPARVVNVTSNVVRQFARLQLDDLHSERRYGQLDAYRKSKLALLLFTRELAQREDRSRVLVNCLHPGDVLTQMTARGFFIDLIRPLLPRVSAETAALACTRLALDPALSAVSGEYFEADEPRSLRPRHVNAATSQTLWWATRQMLHEFLPPAAEQPLAVRP